MTVGELRRALEGVPDDMPVASYDEGILSDEVRAGVEMVARGKYPMEVMWEGRIFPPGTVGKPYFVVSA